MDKKTLLEELKKKLDIDVYVAQVVKDVAIIMPLFDIIENDKSSIKYLCEKIIRKISEDNPEILYPYFERMSKLLDSENNFIKLGFILTLPNMIKADKDNKWEKISAYYLSLIDTDSIIVFGNAASSLWKLLNKYPGYEEIVMPKLLSIDRHLFLNKGEVSPECTNVAIGHIIDFFDKTYTDSNYKKDMISFARINVNNSRNQVRSKAKAFLKKHNQI